MMDCRTTVSTRRILSFFFCVMCVACQAQTSHSEEETVATIDSTTISSQQLRRAWEMERLAADGAGGTGHSDEVQQLRAVLDHLITTRTILLEAQAAHTTVVQSDVDAALSQMSRGFDEATWNALLKEHQISVAQLRVWLRERLLVERYLKAHVQDRIAIFDSAIDDYVLAHPEVLKASAQVRLKQILLTDPNQMTEVRKATRKGLALSEAAIRFSQAPDGAQGGDLGWVDEASVPQAIWQHVAKLPAQQLSAPYTDVLGTHLFWISERLPARKLKLKEVRQQIELRLRQDAEAEATRHYLAKLEESHHVVIDHHRLSALEGVLCATHEP